MSTDNRFDLPWSELDKIKRRLDIRYRLKDEGIRKRYDPFLQMKGVKFTDPAIDRYADLRKTGRQPGAPFNPKLFYTLIAMLVIPYYTFYKIADWERKPYLEGCASGDISYKERPNKGLIGLDPY